MTKHMDSKHKGHNNLTNKESLEESNETDCVYYICAICGYECRTEEIRLMHMETKHKDYSECLICYKMVGFNETMKDHFNNMHKDVEHVN